MSACSTKNAIRRYVRGGSDLCKCGQPRRSDKARYCLACHAAKMTELRKGKPLTPEERKKGICRRMSKYYVSTGKLTKQPCEVCGESKVEMHHPNYNEPLNVRWFCRKHHLEHHSQLN